MSESNAEQKEFWEEFAVTWVERQTELDNLMSPVLEGVLSRAGLQPGQHVLDIGCGTGASCLQAAKAVAPDGSVLGADISDQMLRYARHRARGNAMLKFETVDVAEHPFVPSSFDQVISRFGVMFFSDPVAAFENVRRAMKPGALLTMACWSNLQSNPWFHVPMLAAKARLGAPPAIDPDEPGPLAFRDTKRVEGILHAAGFVDLNSDVETTLLTPPGDLDRVSDHAAQIGPASRAIRYFEASKDDIAAIVADIREQFAAYETPNGVLVPAEINYFTAHAPGAED